MSLADKNANTGRELRRVPRGELPQNIYRSVLQQALMNSQGRKPEVLPTAEAAHAVALRVVRQQYPDFVPTIREG
jgi:hypothetical protein